MPIRVLYLQSFKRTGGAERALLGLAEAIRKTGVDPLVVWPRRDRGFTWLQSRGIRTAAVNVPSWRHGLSLPLLPLVLARLRRVFPPEGIDVVHTNNYRSAPFGGMVSRWAKVPFVCHVRELITPEKIRQYRLRSPDALIAVSGAVSHALVGGGIPLERITIVHSGIGLPVAAPEEHSRALRKGLGILPDDLVVGIVAHILPHKGFDDLIRALALIREKTPGVRCVIVGGAPRKRYLRRLLDLAERLSVRDRLILVGFQDEVAPFLRVMDLVALPSRTEGFPVTILEAMAASRPVVATSVGGVSEAVRDGRTGILVPPGDPRRLAEAIIGLLDSPGLARAMGQEGRKLVESVFTLEAEAEQTSMVYRQVLAASSPDPAAGRAAGGPGGSVG